MESIDRLLAEVERYCRSHYIFMLGPQKARFLVEKLRESRPALVVECGTAIGYSGLHITRALRENGNGRLITVEIDPERARRARRNFERAGMKEIVDSRVGDAAAELAAIEEKTDFLLLDNNYENYFLCFQAIERNLSEGAIILADNVGVGSYGLKGYLDYVRKSFRSRTVWFDTDLPWLSRDAMELTIFRSQHLRNPD
jgi:predicted O-methyltransferase YrrM